MRAHFSTGWIFQGWIVCLIFALCIQRRYAKPTCDQHQYLRFKKCCRTCEPGTYLSAYCTETSDTKCRPCGKDEYQSEYSTEEKCHKHDFCDDGRGFFRPTPSSTTKSEPCQCKEGFQCTTDYCEVCGKIPQCPTGQGLTGERGNQSCKECKEGFFSDSNSAEPCKKWTDCKAIGKMLEKPGSARADVVCGPPFVPSTSWAMVAVPCTIIVIFAIILSCYKDKLNLLSVNLRTCVQNIKRSRIQQETLAPPYQSNGMQNHSQFEITSCLIPKDNNPPEYLSMCCETKIDSSASQDTKTQDKDDGADSPEPARERPDGSGSSTEGSVGMGSPLSCSCLFLKEPMEVGENEDCSELVATGLAGCCSCSQAENLEEILEENAEARSGQDGSVSLNEPPLCGDCCAERLPERLQGSQELYLDFGGAAGKKDTSEIRDLHSDPCAYERNGPLCCSIESTTVPLTSSSCNNRGLSLVTRDGTDLPEAEADLEIQNQNTDTLTCAQVTGNNNTTFISTGQVMNFTGDVIMVYVSQTSLGSSGEAEEPYASPVQEESAECCAQNLPKLGQCTEENERLLPVQEMTNLRPQLNIPV
ncbi:tumor necrosis factor receptor superfamily member 11A [Trichomycterus rosablanca]|uniref:tumor necrosis factor receptor superfamily member 11A n=1 Tax=Trichomycterus rosablanca TaxID=2290929 RepID=UPI002F3501D8